MDVNDMYVDSKSDVILSTKNECQTRKRQLKIIKSTY